MDRAQQLLRFIETVRSYIGKILENNRVVSPEKDVSVFDDRFWRTFWYDPVSGSAAISAWDSSLVKSKDEVDPDWFMLPKPLKSFKLAYKERYAVYQFPPAIMLPFTKPNLYTVERLKDMKMDEFHASFPKSIPLIDIPNWTQEWCRQIKL